MRYFTTLGLVVVSSTAMAADPAVSGDAVIRGRAGASEIVLTTTSRLAGAVHSLTWGGKEFIDSTDHGRQLQSACSFDRGKPGEFWAEAYNPTEAGSRADGAGPRSTSRLLGILAADDRVLTITRMAYWLAPGEQSSGHPAGNSVKLSDHLLTKRIAVGVPGFPHAIDYRVTFTVPPGERHTLAQFEALTGYMPAEFSRFFTLNLKSGKLQPLSDGPGEQAEPVVFATESGAHAMGVWSPEPMPGYGRFRFVPENVVKWNCVFRVRAADGVKAGDYTFRVYAAVGSAEDVRRTLLGLATRVNVME